MLETYPVFCTKINMIKIVMGFSIIGVGLSVIHKEDFDNSSYPPPVLKGRLLLHFYFFFFTMTGLKPLT